MIPDHPMKSVTHARSFEIGQPIEILFPLFSPEGEKHWVPGWDYVNVMGTTDLSEDYIFLTRSPDHGKDAIWVVKQYEPASHLVQFYRIEPGIKVGVVTVGCTSAEPGRTTVEVTYQYTALSEAGERFIAGFDASTYSEFIGEWETLLTLFFESGSRSSAR